MRFTRITARPDQMGGIPCIRALRIPVATVVDIVGTWYPAVLGMYVARLVRRTFETFISTTDFAALRAEHPKLAGDTHCRVRLYRHEDGLVRWEVVQSR